LIGEESSDEEECAKEVIVSKRNDKAKKYKELLSSLDKTDKNKDKDIKEHDNLYKD
jgi:hypothetical protein